MSSQPHPAVHNALFFTRILLQLSLRYSYRSHRTLRGVRADMQNPLEAEQTVSRLLAERVGARDANAERDLWLTYARGLRFLIRRRTHDDDLAQDVVQESFRIAIGHLRAGMMENPDALGSYLRGISLNVLSTMQRRREREVSTDLEDPVFAFAADDKLTPLEATSLEERQAMVRELIAALPVARDRELLWRYFVLDEDKAGLCIELTLDPEHFDRVLHRAKRRFRELAERHGIVDQSTKKSHDE